ncbi:MAG: hypothetical protein UW32_C0001G0212 [Candidatus Wolfebacteria bacterium GW2011_GWE2_44_13]|uniref:Kazal-like domain-containing protein n=1 Tax=Candidatus Wolfebacteria bacterium GW2011_GWE2_44_13 TaxID=1619017 RepID=A0A0G1HA45_9BACT|nr:MAG: hypothetical protein UW32_C0001G0212 [Candidatus Wolfebacteria bacterium GW2011_GWE2_44_13]
MYKIKSKTLMVCVAILIVMTLTTPVITYAAWWNPVSWFKVLVSKIIPKREKAPEKPQPQATEDSGFKNASSSSSTPEYQVATGNDYPQQNNTGSSNNSSQSNSQNANSNATYYDETPEFHVASSSGGQSSSACPDTGQPMCGTNGVTYRNYCELQSAGATYNYGSACVPPANTGSSTGSASGSNSETSVGYSTGSNATTDTNASAASTTATGSASNVNTNTTTGSGTATTGGSGAEVVTFSCGLSANPSQAVNLRNRTGSYEYRPIPATVGADIKWYTNIINTGPDDMGEWKSENIGIGTRCYSTVYYQIDLNSDNTWDVTMKGDMAQLRATDPNMVDHFAIKNSSSWKAVAGNHAWRICADGANKIDETNETDNCVEGTIEVK